MSDQDAKKNVSTEPAEEEVLDEEFRPTESDGDMFGSAPAKKAKAFWPSAKRLVGLLSKDRRALVFIFLAVAASVVLTVVAPKILGKAMDVIFNGILGAQLPAGVPKEQIVAGARAEGNNNFADLLDASNVVPGQGVNFNDLSFLILVVLSMYFVSGVFQWAQGYVLNRIVMKAIRKLRDDVEAKLNRLPLSYFDTGQRGDVLSRVTNDVDNVQQGMQQAFSQLVSSVLLLVGYVVMMFIVSWQLALIALIAIPLSGVVVGVIGVRSQKLFANQWKNTGMLNGQIEESFSGHSLVKVFGRQADMLERFEERNEALFKASFGAQFVSGMMMPIMQWVNYLSYVGIAVIGGLRVASGQMTLGDATAFIQYSREFNQPLAQMGGMANQLQSGVASAERVFEFLDADEQEPDSAQKHLPARTDGHVEFQQVSFSYSEDKPLIEDLSFAAKPGSTVAIVGPTGAGKTTLVNLVMRFYELQGGQITLDGVDITELSRAELRSKVGMVLQDAWLFGGTIYDNIRYGNLDATQEQVLAAAKATYVDRFVRALPEGYQTILDDEGTSLSAGEMQLITIARAFVSDPSLLILDEATSSVDTRTEVLVQKAMAALRADRTSFVIAHRLSTIRDADTILMMEQGRIVEQGSHQELLAAGGAYYRLYQAQFAGEDAEARFDADQALEQESEGGDETHAAGDDAAQAATAQATPGSQG
ncbi:ABC transporter ATP-binding protein/permease [Acaricomes phytoseiuli]|uniref:ABC transporter ATP-binding protein n=1 Tax=Acaricomes phytoseiuli TaxID=291968 RepID=UPI000372B90B|nr:ABC transporter ATP-binding protein [Acaricomes phytoseiuli]MCW1249472.1 ABC transporter ATP-binding protein/permease [Acaricomes phytoseiuli]